jgi:large subunit ribosomal protein L3
MAKRKGLLAKKLGMTRIFGDTGEVASVTVLQVGPCFVTQVKSEATDGYDAIQLGFGHAKRLNKPEAGHLAGRPPLRHLREIRTDDADQYQVGQLVNVGVFQPGDRVDVVGVSKGKGFAGVMKRHHFKGGPATHGQSDRQRAPGAIGSTTTPGRVLKGMRGPGHMGNKRATVLNLKVVKVDSERNLLALEGAVPGPTGAMLLIRNAVKI